MRWKVKQCEVNLKLIKMSAATERVYRVCQKCFSSGPHTGNKATCSWTHHTHTWPAPDKTNDKFRPSLLLPISFIAFKRLGCSWRAYGGRLPLCSPADCPDFENGNCMETHQTHALLAWWSIVDVTLIKLSCARLPLILLLVNFRTFLRCCDLPRRKRRLLHVVRFAFEVNVRSGLETQHARRSRKRKVLRRRSQEEKLAQSG